MLLSQHGTKWEWECTTIWWPVISQHFIHPNSFLTLIFVPFFYFCLLLFSFLKLKNRNGIKISLLLTEWSLTPHLPSWAANKGEGVHMCCLFYFMISFFIVLVKQYWIDIYCTCRDNSSDVWIICHMFYPSYTPFVFVSPFPNFIRPSLCSIHAHFFIIYFLFF